MDLILVVAGLLFGGSQAEADPRAHPDGHRLVIARDWAGAEWISERRQRDRQCLAGLFLDAERGAGEPGDTWLGTPMVMQTVCWRLP